MDLGVHGSRCIAAAPSLGRSPALLGHHVTAIASLIPDLNESFIGIIEGIMEVTEVLRAVDGVMQY